MKTIGYCTSCHKIKYVNVNVSTLAQPVMQGVCDDCEREAEAEKKKGDK